MRALLHRFGLGAAALSLLLPGIPAAAAPANAPMAVIAVRVDARPFIWRDAGTGQYLGFLWDVCTEAVQRAGYTFSETEVKAEERAAFLATGTGGYDLLCDPTTLTLERFANFTTGGPDRSEALRALTFSPIIFVANSSYVENVRNRLLADVAGDPPSDCEPPIRTQAPDDNAVTRAPGGSTNEEGARNLPWPERLEQKLGFTLRPKVATEPDKYQIWGYVSGSTSGERLRRNPPRDEPDTVCLLGLPSHAEAAAAFCGENLDRYYGDLDIVREAIADWSRQHGAECTVPARTNADAGFYEPYAFVLSSGKLHDFPERFTLALYGMFNDGTIGRLFDGHFADAPRSPYLPTLFRLNSIPAIASDAAALTQEAPP